MRRRTVAWVVVSLAAVAIVTAVAWRRPAAQVTAPKAEPAPIEFLARDLWTVQPTALSRSLPLTGTLRAAQQTVVKTRVAGDLTELAAREGQTVKAGQIVARIDATEYDWRVKREQAALEAAQAQFDQATRTRENNAQLAAKGFISQNAFDTAQSGLDAARGNRDAAAAALQLARKALADTVIRAPMGGQVAERFAQPGEKLPVDGRILSIIDLASIELEAPVPADSIAAVRIGQRVDFRPEGAPRTLSGRVARINPATAAGSRSVMIYVAIDTPDPALRAGMFAHGSLLLERTTAPVVPASAVREESGRAFLLALRDAKLAQVPVTLGVRGRTDEGVEVIELKDGLAAGMQVVRVFDDRLPVNAPVKVALPPAATAVK
ncbi:MAG TPA: efflux RND transporter periplasmic adaptor subunit [Burkholderiaceae bacterium]|nr:efflux RND transporter periplasmic adaptor subunit [Burkholderiaceae bacterium]